MCRQGWGSRGDARGDGSLCTPHPRLCGISCLRGTGLGDAQLGASPYPLAPRLGRGRFCCKPRAWPQRGAACTRAVVLLVLLPRGRRRAGETHLETPERGAWKWPRIHERCPQRPLHHSPPHRDVPKQGSAPPGRAPWDTVGISAGGRALGGCCRSSVSSCLGPCPGEGEICPSLGAKYRIPVGPLMPARVQTPPALVWFVPGPVTPMLTWQNLSAPLSTGMPAAPAAEPSRSPQPSATGTIPVAAGGDGWTWRTFSQVSHDAGEKTACQRSLNRPRAAGTDSPAKRCWSFAVQPCSPVLGPRAGGTFQYP